MDKTAIADETIAPFAMTPRRNLLGEIRAAKETGTEQTIPNGVAFDNMTPMPFSEKFKTPNGMATTRHANTVPSVVATEATRIQSSTHDMPVTTRTATWLSRGYGDIGFISSAQVNPRLPRGRQNNNTRVLGSGVQISKLAGQSAADSELTRLANFEICTPDPNSNAIHHALRSTSWRATPISSCE